MAIEGSVGQAPPEENMGTRLMLSTPPPMPRSDCPDMICPAIMLQASSPLAQNRLICTPGTRTSKSALSTAARAMSAPSSPTGSTQPSTTSSICVLPILLRAAIARQHLGGQFQRRHAMQRAVFLAAPSGRPYGVIDIAVGHNSARYSLSSPQVAGGKRS